MHYAGAIFEVICDVYLFFFFKQKTAYEMRISDWSSDVCSSDLARERVDIVSGLHPAEQQREDDARLHLAASVKRADCVAAESQIGRASCRERVCQYV